MTLIWRKETIETEVVCGFACNMCGLVVQPGVGVPTVEQLNARVTGLIGAVVHAGYDVEHLTDGVTYSFSICEKCLSELFNQFKVPVTVKDINDVGDLFDNLGTDPAAVALAAAAITFTAEEVKGWNTNDDGVPYMTHDEIIAEHARMRAEEDCNVGSPTLPTPEEVEDMLGPACSVEEMTRRQALATEVLDYVMTPRAERASKEDDDVDADDDHDE